CHPLPLRLSRFCILDPGRYLCSVSVLFALALYGQFVKLNQVGFYNRFARVARNAERLNFAGTKVSFDETAPLWQRNGGLRSRFSRFVATQDEVTLARL